MVQDSSPLSLSQRLRVWGQIARQVIDLRLALVMGLLAFMLAVSVDSAGNSAAAADLASATYRPSVLVVQVAPDASQRPAAQPAAGPLPENPAAARRLHHGMMTSAILTNNRLTEAHFFTDLPTEE